MTAYDGRTDKNTQIIGQPMPCQLEERPVYPVRFSLTKVALDSAAQSGEVPPMPTGIDDPNYELRRLRQGYLYIYSGKHIGNATDGTKKKWLIFEYNVSREDSNAPEISEDRSGAKIPYNFTQYIWTEGNAHGKWEKEKTRGFFPYAYINPQTAIIEFAYSEYRWPPELFEKLEKDESARAKIMQKLPLKTLESAFSFVLTEESLKQRVADFNPDMMAQDRADSQRRATSIGYDDRHQIKIPKAGKNGDPIVIAVYDPIGNIRDISAFHLVTLANDAQERAKELYPIVTAKAVESLKPLLRKDSFNGYPVKKGLETEMAKYLKYRPTKYEAEMLNLAKVQRALLEQTGAYTTLGHLDVLNGLLNDYFMQLNKLSRVANYTMDFYASAMSGLSAMSKGIAEQAKLLELQTVKLTPTALPEAITTNARSWGDHLKNILVVSSKCNSLVQEGTERIEFSRLKFDILIGEISAGQLHLWQKTATNSLMLNHYMSVFGLEIKLMSSTKMKDAVAIIQTQLEDLIYRKRSITNIDSQKYFSQFEKEETLAKWFKVNVSDQSKASQLINNNTQRIGLFLAAGSLLMNLDKWLEPQEDTRVTNRATTQLIADFSVLVAAFERKQNTIPKEGLNKLFEKVAKELRIPLPHSSASGMGLMNKVFSFKTAGRIGSVAAIVIAYDDIARGSGSGDKAKKLSGIILAAGEICGLLATFSLVTGFFPGLGVLGFVLALVSFAVQILGDNPYESWVRTGFWGNSDDYWNDKVRPQFENQISLAEKLSYLENNNDFVSMKKLFDKEMQGYYNLVWGITVTAKANQWHLLEVRSPAFTEDKNSQENLQVKVQIEEQKAYIEDLSDMAPVEVSIEPARSLTNNGVLLDLSTVRLFRAYKSIRIQEKVSFPTRGLDILTVKVRCPKLGEKTEGFFNKLTAEYFEGEITLEGIY